MTWAPQGLSVLAGLLSTGYGEHSLAVLDVDGLGAFNLARGRSAGDAVLAAVPILLGASLAASPPAREPGERALVERWTGDQFVVVLPHTSAERAAHALAAALADCRGRIACTLSAGGASSPGDGTTNLDLMSAAAAALRTAKRAGGDRVEWAPVRIGIAGPVP